MILATGCGDVVAALNGSRAALGVGLCARVLRVWEVATGLHLGSESAGDSGKEDNGGELGEHCDVKGWVLLGWEMEKSGDVLGEEEDVVESESLRGRWRCEYETMLVLMRMACSESPNWRENGQHKPTTSLLSHYHLETERLRFYHPEASFRKPQRITFHLISEPESVTGDSQNRRRFLPMSIQDHVVSAQCVYLGREDNKAAAVDVKLVGWSD